jgi:uncharacterized protein (DUF2336 family)
LRWRCCRGRRRRNSGNVAGALAAHDAAGALQWAEQPPDGPARCNALQRIAARLADSNPREAVALAERLPLAVRDQARTRS